MFVWLFFYTVAAKQLFVAAGTLFPVTARMMVVSRQRSAVMAAMILRFRFLSDLGTVQDWIEVSFNSLDR